MKALSRTARDCIAAFRSAPLIVIGLSCYLAVPSRFIFPEGSVEQEVEPWHAAHAGWYDALLLTCLIAAVFLLRPRIPAYLFGYCLFSLGAVVGSILINAPELGAGPVWDGLLFWLRFWVPYFAITALVLCRGAHIAEVITIGVGALLMLSSLFVLQLQYGVFNRVYASGMSVGSFAQVMLVVFLVGLLRNNVGVIIAALSFLLFTFSRTTLIIAFLFSGYYVLFVSNIERRKRVVYALMGLLVCVIVASVIFVLPEFRWVAANRLDTAEIETLNSRTLIWNYALDLLRSGQIPLTGIGYNLCPSLLWMNPPVSADTGEGLYFASFHSILFEFVIGMGILSAPILLLPVWRLWTTWKSRCYLPFMILSAFVLAQAFDFTLYPPKEVVTWAVFLGLAEGEWILHRRRLRRQILAPKALAMTRPFANASLLQGGRASRD